MNINRSERIDYWEMRADCARMALNYALRQLEKEDTHVQFGEASLFVLELSGEDPQAD